MIAYIHTGVTAPNLEDTASQITLNADWVNHDKSLLTSTSTLGDKVHVYIDECGDQYIDTIIDHMVYLGYKEIYLNGEVQYDWKII